MIQLQKITGFETFSEKKRNIEFIWDFVIMI